MFQHFALEQRLARAVRQDILGLVDQTLSFGLDRFADFLGFGEDAGAFGLLGCIDGIQCFLARSCFRGLGSFRLF